LLQASKLEIDSAQRTDATEEIRNSKRAKQEGRIPLSRWPGKALLPFLTEVSLFIPLFAQRLQTPSAYRKTSNWAALLEYQSCKTARNFFVNKMTNFL
jgi:hypothetical protein